MATATMHWIDFKNWPENGAGKLKRENFTLLVAFHFFFFLI